MSVDFTRYPDNKLPLPLLKKHSLMRKSMMLESKLDSGYTRKRRRFKNPPAEMAAGFLFSKEQFAIFEGWFENIIFSGQYWFQMPVKCSIGVIDHECQFIGDYSAKPVTQSKWQVTAKIKIKNLNVISEEETVSRIHDVSEPAQALHDALDDSLSDYVSE